MAIDWLVYLIVGCHSLPRTFGRHRRQLATVTSGPRFLRTNFPLAFVLGIIQLLMRKYFNFSVLRVSDLKFWLYGLYTPCHYNLSFLDVLILLFFERYRYRAVYRISV